jgi:hypothetical protein
MLQKIQTGKVVLPDDGEKIIEVTLDQIAAHIGLESAISLVRRAIFGTPYKVLSSRLKYQLRCSGGCVFFELLHKQTGKVVGWACDDDLHDINNTLII